MPCANLRFDKPRLWLTRAPTNGHVSRPGHAHQLGAKAGCRPSVPRTLTLEENFSTSAW